MKNEQVSIDAIIDLQVSHGLNANIIEELVIESTDWKRLFEELTFVLDFFIINVLQVVVNESISIRPEALRRDNNEPMGEFFFLARRRNGL